MSSPLRRRFDRDAAERLLSGASVDPQDDLARLLAVASAAGQPSELAGEETTMNAFRAHHVGQVRPPAKRRLVRTSVANFLTVKVALASAVAVAATGGVALAATTGALPHSLGGVSWTGPRPHPTPQPSAPTSAGITLSPSPSPRDLCRAYRAGVAEGRGRILDDPQFQALIDAAGGRNEVAAHCDALLTVEDDGDQAPPTDDKPGRPSGKPARPSGKPVHPTGQPDNPAGGPPTSTPSRQQGRPTGQPPDGR
jgi:hypothetical protein